MSLHEKKPSSEKKRRSDSDGVTVKRSYYSFSKYYPGGGSSQKYRRVMKETRDEKRPLHIALAVAGLIAVIFLGYLTTTTALDISYAPTTEVTEPQTQEQDTTVPAVIDTTRTTEKETTRQTTESTTIEEPEREINITSFTEETTQAEAEEVTEPEEVFTGY